MAARTEIERLGLGRLERLDLKSFWGEQLPDLTPWFLQNIDLLSETLGIDITPLEREVNVDTSAFNVLGADATGRPIVIENRLEATDHNQLGQMIVHASGLDEAVVIWVAPRFHEEFRRGLDWLNDRTDQKVDFFGVEIGLVRIGRSLPAPVLDVVVQPRNWRKSGRRQVRLPVGTPFPGPLPTGPEPRSAPEPTDGAAASAHLPPPPLPMRTATAPQRGQHEPPPSREPPDPAEPDTPSPVAGPNLTPAPPPPPPPSLEPDVSGRHLPASPPPMASEQAGGLQPAELRHRFFESMFDFVAIRRPGFRIPKFGYENWVGFAAGPFGFYDVAFTANGAVRAGVYLDMQERTATKRLFDDLFAERLAVETAVGRVLSWERLDDRRASRIVDYREVHDLDNPQERQVLADWAAETVVKLMEALDDRLRSTAQVLLSRVQGGV
ncbi:MAG TPA: DUF4268 domain-containing protein [Actinomycetota bacterium]|nr:DUF4268 domain-containing protein [Actinomycetota bacterium]